MRTTLNIADELLTEAGKLMGTSEKTALVRMGLEALIEREAARKLAALGGAMPGFSVVSRPRNRAAGRK
jgi:Arc/MetJ family transcription regulator